MVYRSKLDERGAYMEEMKLHDGEYKFVSVIWELEPIKSPDLVKACEERLGWNKSTTYTVLRKLAMRGILKNENTIVTAIVKREQIQKYEADALLGKVFDGSIPTFIATFLQDKALSDQDIQAIEKMIKEAKK